GDGLETTFEVNHLAYFLLTELLLDKLKASAPARIINVASNGHFRSRLTLEGVDDLPKGTKFSGFEAYCDSKLCNILYTFELGRGPEGRGVAAICLHPGAIASNWGQTEGPRWFRFLMKLGKPFLLSVDEGAQTQIFLACSPEVANVSGKYFAKSRVGK